MLTYRFFHVLFTLPPTAVLLLLYRPFWNPVDKWRIIFFCTVAMLWTTPWDNWIVWRKAWWYCDKCVLFTVGYVPIEEYFFFIIQSIMTTLLTLLLSRWQYPVLYLHSSGPDPHKSSGLLRMVSFIVTSSIVVGGWIAAQPFTKTFYMGAISWWAFVPLTLLLTGTLPYALRRWKSYFIAIWIPTLYLWFADQYALKRGTWHINEATSLEIFTIDELPIEEAVFFLVTNMLIVTGNFAIDKCLAIIKFYPDIIHPSHNYLPDLSPTSPLKLVAPSYIPRSLKTLSYVWSSYLIPEESLPYQRIKHFKGALEILSKASKSFHAASWMFPWDLRMDMAILYGFCRATDDLIDDSSLSPSARRLHVTLVRQLIDAVYSSAERAAAQRNVEAFCKLHNLPEWANDAACAFTWVKDAVPKENVQELVKGYEMDLDGVEIKNVDDLYEYSEYVAGSVGAMCTHLLLNRTRDETGNVGSSNEKKIAIVVRRARDMGLSLQLTNIARDILTDSITLNRCYIPSSFFTPQTMHIKSNLLLGSSAPSMDPAVLRPYADQILDLADGCYDGSVGAIHELPASCRGGVRAACDVYRSIAAALRKAQGYPRRVYVGKARRVWVGLKALYRQG